LSGVLAVVIRGNTQTPGGTPDDSEVDHLPL